MHLGTLVLVLAAGSRVLAIHSSHAQGIPVRPLNAAGPLYKLPTPGAPPARIGGVNRGVGSVSVKLTVLAPNHVGLTSRDQPRLYWYLSNPVESEVEITITREDAVAPTLAMLIAGSNLAGVQSIALAEHGVRLAPDTDYRWHIAVVLNKAHRSRDIVASGVIRRVELQPDQVARLARLQPAESVAFHAQQGYWYDALESAWHLEGGATGGFFATLLNDVGIDIVAR